MKTKSTNRRAFTLVEILVVITIIGILAALSVKGLAMAMWGAKQTAIKLEVDGLATQMQSLKETYGVYPPCNLTFDQNNNPHTPNPGLRAFVAKAFPRYTPTNYTIFETELNKIGIDTVNFNPAQALVFWLSGFNSDPRHPFRFGETFVDTNKNGIYDNNEPYTDSNGNGKYDWVSADVVRTPTFAFDKTRIVDGTYVPQNGRGVPYVYFDYRAYTSAGPLGFSDPTRFESGSTGVATPYALDVDGSRTLNPKTFDDTNQNGTYDEGENIPDPGAQGYLETKLGLDTWANPDSFQIISAGQDGMFGCPSSDPQFSSSYKCVRLFPAGAGYHSYDSDNVTNFCKNNSLDSAKP